MLVQEPHSHPSEREQNLGAGERDRAFVCFNLPNDKRAAEVTSHWSKMMATRWLKSWWSLNTRKRRGWASSVPFPGRLQGF